MSEYVLVCLLLQMVIVVQLSRPRPAAPPQNPPQPHDYVQRSLAESAARTWDAEHALMHEQFRAADPHQTPAGIPVLQLQNVSLPEVEPAKEVMHPVE